ncbi:MULTISPECIES: AAA family ATPase [Streptomyces]|uniref:AAA family ATPase n=1 Tax=Streptomyces fungicidicus TaxID=68203 RepID=A0ACC7XVF9_9ACTN|nr:MULTISPECIES: AAA family ATPase [Streptomyces]MBF4133807.1 AAA family ATPase [Streptomyces albidoflavus]NUV73602.1 AAA family ATPase [Streptomyces fungicidicus]PBO29480.1 ATP-binding protein [Streptomyces albidoflavus]
MTARGEPTTVQSSSGRAVSAPPPSPGGPAPALATTLPALPAQPGARQIPATVRDLRATGDRPAPDTLTFGQGDLVVVSGLPGSGKSTLIRRTVRAARADSQDTREQWEARLPAALPYALYRPLARLAHYAALRRLLGAGRSVVVHDCGTQRWVRHWLAREARRRGRTLHMVFLDVDPDTALDGQRARGRGVSRYAFLRHRRVVARLLATLDAGTPPPGCGSATLLDRAAADRLRTLTFRA